MGSASSVCQRWPTVTDHRWAIRVVLFSLVHFISALSLRETPSVNCRMLSPRQKDSSWRFSLKLAGGAGCTIWLLRFRKELQSDYNQIRSSPVKFSVSCKPQKLWVRGLRMVNPDYTVRWSPETFPVTADRRRRMFSLRWQRARSASIQLICLSDQ